MSQEKKPKLTLDEAKEKALDKIPNTARPKTYYCVSPDKARSECLLWGYHKQSKYFEVVGCRHKSMLEFKDPDDNFLATGRIFEGRGSVLFNKKDILSQRIVAEELWSRYPLVKWWVFSEYDRGPVRSLKRHMGDD